MVSAQCTGASVCCKDVRHKVSSIKQKCPHEYPYVLEYLLYEHQKEKCPQYACLCFVSVQCLQYAPTRVQKYYCPQHERPQYMLLLYGFCSISVRRISVRRISVRSISVRSISVRSISVRSMSAVMWTSAVLKSVLLTSIHNCPQYVFPYVR